MVQFCSRRVEESLEFPVSIIDRKCHFRPQPWDVRRQTWALAEANLGPRAVLCHQVVAASYELGLLCELFIG